MRERDSLFGSNREVDTRGPKYARWNELVEQERRIDTKAKWPKNVLESRDLDELKAFCMAFVVDSAVVLTDAERSTLVAIADEVDTLLRACREAGNYTSETILYLERYEANQNLRFAEAFPAMGGTRAVG